MKNLINPISFETPLELFILASSTLFIALIVYFLSKKYLVKVIHKLILKTKCKWDDVFLQVGLFEEIVHIIPPLIILFSLQLYPENISSTVSNIIEFWIAVVIIKIVNKFLSGILEVYNSYEIAIDKPIKGYIQLMKMIKQSRKGVRLSFPMFIVVSIYLKPIIRMNQRRSFHT